MKSHLALIGIAATSVLLLAGCAGTSGVPDADSDMTIVVLERPDTLEPANETANVYPITRNIVETLVSRDAVTGEIVPELATAWEQVSPTIWNLTLREGVEYSNGEPFDAEAAAFGINRAQNADLNLHVTGSIVPMEATAVSDNVLEIETPTPTPALLNSLVLVALPAPEATGDRAGINDPIGTGPYVLESFDPSVSVVLSRNDSYWGDAPTIEQATFIWREESSVRMVMVENGEADIATELAAQDATDEALIKTVTIPETPYLRIDTPCPALADIRVREAINLAIDREGLAETIFGGYATPAATLVTSDVIGSNDSLAPRPFDPDRASELIGEAATDGVPTDTALTIVGRNGIYNGSTEAMEAISGMLNQVGLNTTVEMMDVSPWAEILTFQPIGPDRCALVQSSHGNESGDANTTIRVAYRSDGLVTSLYDPVLDEMEESARVLSGAEREAAFSEIFDYIYTDAMSDAPMVHLQSIYAVADEVTFEPRPDRLLLLKDMSIDQRG